MFLIMSSIGVLLLSDMISCLRMLNSVCCLCVFDYSSLFVL